MMSMQLLRLVNMSGGDANNINSGKRKPSLPPSSLNKLVISGKGEIARIQDAN